MGVSVTVGFAVGATSFFVGVGFLVIASVGTADGDATTTGVGEIKITRITLSSGTGESIFPLDITTPRITTIKITNPVIRVMAAIVFLRSSIPLVYHYFISSFFHAANVHAGYALHP